MSAVPGYGAVPPVSRVASAIAARLACGPPLTSEPLRPLTAQWHGQEQSPCPPNCMALTAKSHKTESLRFQGIAAITAGEGKAQVVQSAVCEGRVGGFETIPSPTTPDGRVLRRSLDSAGAILPY